jgi:hypothetical protein
MIDCVCKLLFHSEARLTPYSHFPLKTPLNILHSVATNVSTLKITLKAQCLHEQTHLNFEDKYFS